MRRPISPRTGSMHFLLKHLKPGRSLVVPYTPSFETVVGQCGKSYSRKRMILIDPTTGETEFVIKITKGVGDE